MTEMMPARFMISVTSRCVTSMLQVPHLVKVAVKAALGLRSKLVIYGTDYPTPDGTCIRDYIHVSDLVRAHSDALRYLRGGGALVTLNCGYGHGFSVREVIEMVKQVSGVDFGVEIAPRRPGDLAQIVAASDKRGSWMLQLADDIAGGDAWRRARKHYYCRNKREKILRSRH